MKNQHMRIFRITLEVNKSEYVLGLARLFFGVIYMNSLVVAFNDT